MDSNKNSIENNLEYDVESFTVKSVRLGESFDNFRIVLISDTHNQYAKGIAHTIKNQKPDIICIAGDMTDDRFEGQAFIDTLKELLKIAPVFMSSGNHDVKSENYRDFVNTCTNMGAEFLINNMINITKGNDVLTITGVEDPFSSRKKVIQRRLNRVFKNLIYPGNFNILLFHRANLAEMVINRDFDLVLSGHMHGGLIRLPKLGGIFSPKSNLFSGNRFFFPKYTGGEYKFNNSTLIVSRGIANTSSYIKRINNPPHICVIQLKSISNIKGAENGTT